MQTETAESRVRAVWETVHVCDGVQRHRSIAPRPAGTVVIQRGACGEWHQFPSMAEALAFTEERVEQIADIEEEISLVRAWLNMFSTTRNHESIATAERIIAAEQSRLAEARKGMKERA